MANNNETTTKFKVDISELKKAMQEAKRAVAVANSEFKAVSSTMEDWTKSSDGLSAKLKQLDTTLSSQKTVLSNLERQYELTVKEMGEGSKAADDLKIKINNQKAAINNTEREISKYEGTLQEVVEAEKKAAKTGKDVADVLDDTKDSAEDAGDGFTVLKGAVATFVGNALTKLVDGLKEGITNLVTFADEANNAMNSFQASTGATAEEMAEFDGVMKNIYKANYGESFDDIAGAMGEIKRMSGNIGADELEKMTTNALMLRDTFDFEVSESMRAVNALMDQFGIGADEAFNLMAQGAQNGLNQNGDLMDVINEYSLHFQRAGYSAEDMFNMLSNGVETGTWSVDKLGDAVKEFNIRMSDGSAKEAVEALGFSWEGVSESWSAGGDEAKEIFNMLINEMDGMEDSVEGYGIGVGLLGTMFEDLGFDAVYALTQTEGEITNTKDALEEINKVKYKSVGNAISGIGRNLQTSVLMPLGEKLLPIVSDLAVKFEEWLNDPATQEGIKNLTDSIAEFIDNGLAFVKDFVSWFIDNKDVVVAGLAAIAAGFLAFKVVSIIQGVTTALKGMTLAQAALNLAMNANPIGLIIGLVAGLVAGFVALWNNCEGFREFFTNLWEGIKNVVGTVVEAIGGFFSGLWDGIKNVFGGIGNWFGEKFKNAKENAVAAWDKAKEVWSGIKDKVTGAFSKVGDFFKKRFTEAKENSEKAWETAGKVWSGIKDKVTGAFSKVGNWFKDKFTEAKNNSEQAWSNAKTVFTKVKNKVTDAFSNVGTWFKNKFTEAKNNSEKAWSNAKTVFTKVKDKVTGAFSNVGSWFKNKFNEAKENSVNAWSNAKEKFSSVKDKVVGAFNGLGSKLKDTFSNALNKAKDGFSKVTEVGKNIVEGLWNGIKSMGSWIKEKISGFGDSVLGALKDFFGINSPSKVMADEVGKWIPEGIAVGIDKNAKSVLSSMRDVTTGVVGAARDGITTGGVMSAGASVVNNFYQTNNSPKALSRLEIYRQSKNLLGLTGGV